MELVTLLFGFVLGFSWGTAKVKVATSVGDTYVEALKAAAELIRGNEYREN